MTTLTYNSPTYGELAIIPYPVDVGAKESILFFTDVLQSYTAENEDRGLMRAIPRQSLAYTYSLRYLLTMGVFNVAASWIRKNWAIPFWTEAQPVTSTLGQTVFAADTLVHDLRVGGMVLLYGWDQNWQVAEITAASSASVTTSVGATVAGQIFMVPVRRGFISGDLEFSPTGADSSVKFNYYIDDVLTGLGATVPDQYAGQDLYLFPYEVSDQGSTTVSMLDNQVEFDVGNIAHRSTWKTSQYGKKYYRTGKGAADIRALKEFFYRRAGRYRPFVAPSFESNLRKASTGNVASTFKFKDDGFVELMASLRTMIAFGLDDDSWVMRNITGAVSLGGGESQITLDSPLGIDAGRILTASYVGLNRLDTDTLDISHQNGGYFTTSYQVLELT